MEIITVSNGSNEYPGNFTPKEKTIIRYNSTGRVLNLFSGKSLLGDVRVDFSFGNVKEDVFYYMASVSEYFDTVILDAPYNKKVADKYQEIGDTPNQFIIFVNSRMTTVLFDYILKMRPKIIILKSWNYYVPKGYEVLKSYLCYPGGYRKSTILLILKGLEALCDICKLNEHCQHNYDYECREA